MKLLKLNDLKCFFKNVFNNRLLNSNREEIKLQVNGDKCTNKFEKILC